MTQDLAKFGNVEIPQAEAVGQWCRDYQATYKSLVQGLQIALQRILAYDSRF